VRFEVDDASVARYERHPPGDGCRIDVPLDPDRYAGQRIFVVRREEYVYLEAIQKRALAEGLPYQTLISSVLHKYATGRLKEV
jgi:hypothetical protein